MEMELKMFGENYRVTAATMTGRRSENQDCYSLTATFTGTLRGNIMGATVSQNRGLSIPII